MSSIFDIFKKRKKEEKNPKVCPYCHTEFIRDYTRKFKCPNCQEAVHVKRDGDSLTYITKEEAEAIKIEREKESVINSYYNEFELHFSKKQLDVYRNEHLKQHGESASMSDLTWKLYNQLTLDYAKKKDFKELSSLYHRMAIILYQEEKYDKGFKVMQLATKNELLDLQTVNFLKGVQILAGGGDCESCKASNNRTLTIKEALKEMPIPHSDCSKTISGYCTCMYSGIAETDEEMEERWAREASQ